MSDKKNNRFVPLFITAVSLIYFQGNIWSMILGFLVSAAGLALRLKSAGYAASSDKLVTAGPYAHSQNPHFLGNIILFTGIGIMSFALFPFFQILIPVTLFIYYRSLAVAESENAASLSGDEYAEYAAAVPLVGWRIRAYVGIDSAIEAYDASMGRKFENKTHKAFAFIVLTFLIIWFVRIF